MVGGLLACNAGAEQVTQLQALEKKMCDCKDAACAQGVDKEIADWLTKNGQVKVNKANADKLNASLKNAAACGAKVGDAASDKLDDTPVPSEE